MSGLVLKLGPRERVLVNGALIENGDRRSRLLVLTPRANILRLRDALPRGGADTPLRRLCLAAQRVLSGDAEEEQARPELLDGIERLSRAWAEPDARLALAEAAEAVRAGDIYHGFKRLRGLLPWEERRLAAPAGPDRPAAFAGGLPPAGGPP